MILPPKKLKGFSYFTRKFSQGADVKFVGTDIVTLVFDEKNVFGKEIEVKKTFEFTRIQIIRDDRKLWEASQDLEEFIDQLQKIVKGTWTYIDTKIYNELKEENPEYFL